MPDPAIHWQPSLDLADISPYDAIEAPPEVFVGQAVAVTMHTMLLAARWRPQRETVRQTGLVVEVTPYDSYAGASGMLCPRLYTFSSHWLTVTLTSAGTAAVRVHGRRVALRDTTAVESAVAERTLIVRAR